MYPPKVMADQDSRRTVDGLNSDALVAGKYDTRMFKLTPKFKSILARGTMMQVRQDTERRIVLPNGHVVKVSADASGCATQIEDDEHQHAIVRPNAYAVKLTADNKTPDGRDLSKLVAWARESRANYRKRGRRA